MDLSTLKKNPGSRSNRKRVGRGPGSGSGKTCGRGHKGQGSRSGYSRQSGFEGGQMPLHRRLPKRGFRHRDRFPFAIVNVDTLQAAFADGDTVTAEAAMAKGLAGQRKGGLKILGRGELTKKLTVVAQAISPGARAKIESAGGVVEIVAREPKPAPQEAPVSAEAGEPSSAAPETVVEVSPPAAAEEAALEPAETRDEAPEPPSAPSEEPGEEPAAPLEDKEEVE